VSEKQPELTVTQSSLSATHLSELRTAKELLTSPGLAVKITSAIGTPIEKGLKLLPEGANKTIARYTESALYSAVRVAAATVRGPSDVASNLFHTSLVSLTGGVAGTFGLAALAIELPLSTIVMLRSIVDIARSEGELIDSPNVQLACIEVFAFGGTRESDDAADTGYFVVRSALAKTLAEAAEHIAKKGVSQQGAPALVRFLTQVGARFGVPVSQKIAAQAIPVAGAIGGALINAIFIDHFQNMARGHFIVRRLERQYGPDIVRDAYDNL
jgi:hypothetical protein